MKVQTKMSRYGVGPVASLAGTAPGPVPRTDPPLATGQRQPCSKRNVGHPNQKPSPGQPDRSQSLNIFQFNLDGLSEKKTELAQWAMPTSLIKTIFKLQFYRKLEREKALKTTISQTTQQPIVSVRIVKDQSHISEMISQGRPVINLKIPPVFKNQPFGI